MLPFSFAEPHHYTTQYFVPLKRDNATGRASSPHRVIQRLSGKILSKYPTTDRQTDRQKDSKAPLPDMAKHITELQPMRWAVPNPYNRLTFEPMQIAIPQCGGKGVISSNHLCEYAKHTGNATGER